MLVRPSLTLETCNVKVQAAHASPAKVQTIAITTRIAHTFAPSSLHGASAAPTTQNNVVPDRQLWQWTATASRLCDDHSSR